jgi:ATP-binding cassette, subfamily C (CFTR/MRP), member 1
MIGFFDTTPLGRILNRFTGDISTADMGLSAFLSIIITLLVDVTCSLVAISIATSGVILIVLLPLAVIYYRVQLYFRMSNTETRRLGNRYFFNRSLIYFLSHIILIESIAKSPVFTEISQSLSGVQSLRAFNMVDFFALRLGNKVDSFSSISFLKQKLNHWINVRLDSVGAVVSFFVVVLALSSGDFIPPEALAVALTYSFTIPQILAVVMTMGAECEVSYLSNISSSWNYNV